MHLVREVMLRSALTAPLAILRPTLLYGAADPHNGYGPNRFRRLAAAGQDIVLFGEGEEQRDHVLIVTWEFTDLFIIDGHFRRISSRRASSGQAAGRVRLKSAPGGYASRRASYLGPPPTAKDACASV